MTPDSLSQGLGGRLEPVSKVVNTHLLVLADRPTDATKRIQYSPPPTFCGGGIITSEPFVIGLYLGEKKPDDVNEFLKDFIEEMVQIQEAPLRVPDLDTEFDVSISCVICDTPARAYVKKGQRSFWLLWM